MKNSSSARAVGKSLAVIALTVLFLLVGSLFDLSTRNSAMRPAASFYYLFLSVFFALHIQNRVVDRRVRVSLSLSSWMIVLLAFLRAVKYLALREPAAAARVIWYLYYLPILAMPAFLLLAALFHDLRPGKRLHPAAFLPAAVSAVLIAGVLSNDLHFLAFSFRPGFENWDSDYSHGPLYYIAVIWAIVTLFAAVAVFAHKSRLSACKKLTFLPILPMLLALIFILLFLLDRQPKVNGINLTEFPEVLCFFSACFTECCLTIGLIPSNEGCGSLMALSSVSAAISDADGKVVFASSRSALPAGNLKELKTPVFLDENTRLDSAPVHGGRVWWQDDLTAVNQLNKNLEENESRLSEESVLIALQNKLRTELAVTSEKNRVYDLIARSVRAQSDAIARLAREAQESLRAGGARAANENLKAICFFAAYIKRRANLTLLFEDRAEANGGELLLAIGESLRAPVFAERPALLTGQIGHALRKEETLALYDAFEGLTEQALPRLSGLHVAASSDGLRLAFEGAEPSLSAENAGALRAAGIGCEHFSEDGVCYFRFLFGKEGTAA